MKQALKQFFKRPTTIVGIVTALMFQIIFSVIWMTAYDGVTSNTKQLTIAVVNEDHGMGAQILDGLKQNLPFKVTPVTSLQEAQKQLNDRDVQMVLQLPSNFSAQLQTPGGKAQIHYYINESNPALIKSMMSSVAANVTATVNKQAIAQGAAAVLAQAKVPAVQADGIAKGLSERVTSVFDYSNKVDGMNNQMVPMMLVLASFVGAMIMGMNMEQSSLALSHSVNRWQRFAARSVINVVAAVVVALVGASLVMAFGGQSKDGFISIWLFQSLFLLVFMFVAQFFLLLFGMAGMLFNIIMLSLQLVSSGAMVPRELLPSFYHHLSDYLPATYAVRGSMNLLFGGPSVGSSITALLWILLVSLALGLAAVAIRKDKVSVHAVREDASTNVA
ncbi:ABC transporter permease [Paenibacillus sediminis]|uniref:YhgE/Pip-like protein n=1 Tax=Paenibacillus sediminis TaxID=664909 RepID=A0ABS4H2R6_9BACL|nr:ABC transporter permease [Paenibacillus sediminis]MBP1936824.1 YhgE/Pip-like protein [Paenibacillus sediminis]